SSHEKNVPNDHDTSSTLVNATGPSASAKRPARRACTTWWITQTPASTVASLLGGCELWPVPSMSKLSVAYRAATACGTKEYRWGPPGGSGKSQYRPSYRQPCTSSCTVSGVRPAGTHRRVATCWFAGNPGPSDTGRTPLVQEAGLATAAGAGRSTAATA